MFRIHRSDFCSNLEIWSKTVPDVPIHYSIYYFCTKVIETMNIYLGSLQISCWFCIAVSSGYSI